MNKEKAFKNIIVSTIFRVILLVMNLLLRRLLLSYLGTEAVGLFSLYASIIGFLSIAELGIGTAISFSLYKPINDNDYDKISALFYLYKKFYVTIFFIVLGVGLLINPLIPSLAKESSGTYDIYITYSIFLVSSLVPYLFAHKTSFINANLDEYVTTVIRSISVIVEILIQSIIIIYLGKSNANFAYSLFLIVILCMNVFQGIITNKIFKNKYAKKINGNKKISQELRKTVISSTKAMFYHKIGSLMVNATDSIIISSFIGVSILGIYTNFTTLGVGLSGILSLVFTSITSAIGHSFARNNRNIVHNQFRHIYVINIVLSFIAFLGFYAVVDSATLIIFGINSQEIVGNNVVRIMSINYFIIFMRSTVLSFRDASGTFYNDRYKPLIEGIINLVLSLSLVKTFGISGVLIATIITNLCITHIIEPYVLYKYGFKRKVSLYYFYNYLLILLFVCAIWTFDFLILFKVESLFLNFLLKGFISIGVSLFYLLIIYIFSKKFRHSFNLLCRQTYLIIYNLFKKNKKN